MNAAKRAEMRKWLLKSARDLGSARKLMEGEETYLDTAVYHCPQAAEKARKAFLTYQDTVFEKTHDLTALVEQTIALEPAFEDWREVAEKLTPYAVPFRYPGDVLEPERAEGEEALATAEALVDFIAGLLPDEVKPIT